MTDAQQPPINQEELARLGIERVAGFTYRIGGYRYTNLSDAVAQAKRGGAA